MMKILRYAAVGIFALLFLLYIIPSFINWNGRYKNYIAKELEEAYGAKTNISGDIKVSLITAKIVIHDLYLEYKNSDEQQSHKLSNLITIEKLEFRPSFLSLITFRPKPKAIVIHNLTADVKNLRSMTGASKNISIVDSNINIGQETIQIKAASFKSANAGQKITATFMFKQDNYNADIDLAKNTHKVNARIKSHSVNIALTGNKDKNSFDGKLVAKINNPLNVMRGVAGDKVTSTIAINEVFELSSDIYMSDDEFKIHNLKFDSQCIKGSGEISNKKDSLLNIEMNFERIDIDRLMSNKKNIKYNESNNVLENLRLIIPKHININAIIKAQEVKYNNKVSSFEFKTSVLSGKANINFALALPGNNNGMTMLGEIVSDNVVSKFNGMLSAKGDDFDSLSEWLFPVSIKENFRNNNNKFTFSSRIYAAPRIFMISDMKILTNEVGGSGKARVKYNKKVNIIDGEVSVSNINFDKYNLNLLPVKDENKLPMQWLRDTGFNVAFKTDVNNFVVKNNQIKKLGFLINTMKNRLTVSNVQLKGDTIDLSGDIKIKTDLQSTRPVIQVNVSGKKFNSVFIELPGLIEKTKDARSEIAKITWSHNDFNFWGLEEFDGDINVNIEEFKTKFNNLKNFELNTISKAGLISVRQFRYNLEDGYVIFQGNIGTGSEPSLSSSFSITNLDINNIARALEIDNLKGNISISGSVKTQGKNLREWIGKAAGKINLAARGINFTGIDLDSFIMNLLKSKSRSEIASLTQISLYNGSTAFAAIDGSAEIKNGICSTSLQFGIKNASGAISSNISLLQFTTISLFRLFFIPPGEFNPVHVDLNLAGLIWQPKISFNIDALYAIVAKSK